MAGKPGTYAALSDAVTIFHIKANELGWSPTHPKVEPMTNASVPFSQEVSNLDLPHDKQAERHFTVGLIDMPDAWERFVAGLTPDYFLDTEAKGIFDTMVKKSKNGREWLRSDFPILEDRAHAPIQPPPEYKMPELRQRIIDAAYFRSKFLFGQGVATASLRKDMGKLASLLIEQDRALLGTAGATWEGQGFDVLDCVEMPRERGWIVEGLFRDRSVISLAAKGGSKKSMLAHAAGLCVAQGKDFAGLKTIKRPVLIISQDQGEEDYRERSHALMEYYGKPEPGWLQIICFPRPTLALVKDTTALEAKIEQIISEREIPPVVITDSFLAVAGVPSGNDDEAAEAMRAACRLRDQYEITFIAPHHTPHDKKRSRGSAMIANTADYAIFVEVVNGVMRFKNEKPRSALINESVGLEFVYEAYHDSSIMRTCHFKWTSLSEEALKQKEDGRAELGAEILKVVGNRPGIGTEDLKKAIKGRDQELIDVLTEKIEAEEVLVVKEGKTRHHFLPGDEHE